MDDLYIFITSNIANTFAEQVISFGAAQKMPWSLFLSGGSLAPALYQHLGTQKSFLSMVGFVNIFLGDERVVNPGEGTSNMRGVRIALVDPLAEHGKALKTFPPLTDSEFHRLEPILTGEPSIDYKQCEALADSYSAVVSRAPKPWLIHLGIGPDGHTASLFAHSPALSSSNHQNLIRANFDPSGLNPFCRLTLTLEAISQASLTIITTAGRDKAKAVRGLLEGDPSFPISQIRSSKVVLIIDREAAVLISNQL